LVSIGSELSGRRTKRRALVQPVTPAQTAAPTDDRGLVRLALDLHDGPLQDLAALGFMIGQLQRTLDEVEGDTSRAAHELAEVQRQLGLVEATLRSVATSEGTASESVTVIELIEQEANRFKARCDATMEISVVGDVEPETDSQRIVVQRVLRESLSNVARHSRANHVRIAVEAGDEVIIVSVTDDGVGFDPQAVAAEGDRTRLGLTGMRRRLDLLDGSLSVASRIGGPTSVSATIKRWSPVGYVRQSA
jgi:signal transduction histidine kinase